MPEIIKMGNSIIQVGGKIIVPSQTSFLTIAQTIETGLNFSINANRGSITVGGNRVYVTSLASSKLQSYNRHNINQTPIEISIPSPRSVTEDENENIFIAKLGGWIEKRNGADLTFIENLPTGGNLMDFCLDLQKGVFYRLVFESEFIYEHNRVTYALVNTYPYPVITGSYKPSRCKIDREGNRLIVSDYNQGLLAFNLSNPNVSSKLNTSSCTDVAVVRNINKLYYANRNTSYSAPGSEQIEGFIYCSLAYDSLYNKIYALRQNTGLIDILTL